jgi:hypothetical protein
MLNNKEIEYGVIAIITASFQAQSPTSQQEDVKIALARLVNNC